MPRQTKPKVAQHHTKDATMSIRVRVSDIAAQPVITHEHWQSTMDEFVFVRSVSEFVNHRKTASGTTSSSTTITIYTSNGFFKAALWNARDAITVLNHLGIPYEEVLHLREMRGSTVPLETGFGSVLLTRLPQELSRLVAWIVEDDRRYLVVTKGTRTSFSKDDRACILRASQGNVVIMTNSEDQAITIKLKHGGTLFDMEELRALA